MFAGMRKWYSGNMVMPGTVCPRREVAAGAPDSGSGAGAGELTCWRRGRLVTEAEIKAIVDTLIRDRNDR